jgi:hypothetical protein
MLAWIASRFPRFRPLSFRVIPFSLTRCPATGSLTSWMPPTGGLLYIQRPRSLQCANSVVEQQPAWKTTFDVEAWCEDWYSRELGDYKYSEPIVVSTAVPEERRVVLENRIKTFGDHPSGRGKFTRTMFARDLRRTVAGDTYRHPRWGRRLPGPSSL